MLGLDRPTSAKSASYGRCEPVTTYPTSRLYGVSLRAETHVVTASSNAPARRAGAPNQPAGAETRGTLANPSLLGGPDLRAL